MGENSSLVSHKQHGIKRTVKGDWRIFLPSVQVIACIVAAENDLSLPGGKAVEMGKMSR